MKRVLAIWLLNWPVQRLLDNKPELAGRPVILTQPLRRGLCVAACSREAQRAGVRIGMPTVEARTIVELTYRSSRSSRKESIEPVLLPHDPFEDRRQLEELAQWCHRFSPTIGVEASESPETLLLDATNLAPLYGSESSLVEHVVQGLKRRGFAASIALADSLGAAWALAHYSPVEPFIAPQGQTSEILAALPIAALRLPLELLETLMQLGVERIGTLLSWPREQLRSRFGSELQLRLDQALGLVQEVFDAVQPPISFQVEQVLEFPVSQREGIQFVVDKLLERLAWMLAVRCAGALRVVCQFACENRSVVSCEVGLFQPTANLRRLMEVVHLEMERLRLPAPATGVSIEAFHAPLEQRQDVLFDEDRSLAGSRRLAALVDRLAGRLGREAVVRCRLQREVEPELAYREEPLIGERTDRRTTKVKKTNERVPWGALERPLYLLRQPLPLETLAVVPDGPPIQFRRQGRRHTVARHWGPERIETGWWRNRPAAVRDYYRVETAEGQRYWIFRCRRRGKWFLHGAFA
jgi:protein ImuB